MATCWINGQFLKPEEAKVSVFDHGLLYGDGVFEGIRFYQDKPFCLEQHIQRLYDSAQAICLTIPYSQAELTIAIQASIAESPLEHGYIRLVITRGEGALGINPQSCKNSNCIIIIDELVMLAPEIVQNGAKLIIASTRRLPADGLDPRIKSLNYLNHIQARIEANYSQADEAILLNQQGLVTEGTTDNIFITKKGKLLTPPIADGALNGITRQVILYLAKQAGIACTEQSLVPYDLYTADECFLTGTAAELIPVREIDGRKLKQCPGPIYQQLQKLFNQATTQGGNCEISTLSN